MAEEKKESTPPVTTAATTDAPIMTQGKPAETTLTSTVGVPTVPKGQPPPSAGSDLQGNLMLMAAVVIGFYFLLIRPQKKAQDQQAALLAQMKKGDKVLLTSGMYATISDFDGDDATVIIDVNKKDVRVKVRKDGIANVINPDAKEPAK